MIGRIVPLLLAAACSFEPTIADCTAEGWETVGHIGSHVDGCVRVWSISETMSVAADNESCESAIPKRCVVVSRGAWSVVRGKMGSKTQLGMEGYPATTAVSLDENGECPIRCLDGLAPESVR